ncbi:hypothetical protein ASPZODRAFT_148155 [Penicilliopsis zonata CBS 506.65]|uniref:Anoctamin dimerisation domain-containing protein n=1 Tax=Penicilliopsis zonata CBS 506.65 TaxID=1073090 RepID=A0A1L9SU99_9EURO|nr:hypothetical protein ASPZODRAFT_148155 [Penicilliopsis zonata CBS 506.65]OJJ50716.1 hypothetical protein ASPZODRAFT_148155 [Penicilliopsis zonata CBS 506.65]
MAANTLKDNFHVDYVIRYRYGGNTASACNSTESVGKLETLLRTLAKTGLQTQVRQGDESTLLVFVRATDQSLRRAVYQSRVRDWLYGVRNSEPDPTGDNEVLSEAERLRVIHHMLILPRDEGGAGITPDHGEWKDVVALFPLHDEAVNKKWIKEWSQKTFLSPEDLDQIRNKFGEDVGFYFAFLQSYFRFLVFPALFGFACWMLLGSYSVIYTAINCLWGIVFIEYWKRSEVDLGYRWQTRGVSAVRMTRREFRPESQVRDEHTGELCGVFPASKRIYRQLLQIPFALVAAVGLGIIIATCFAIEIFISEVYNGPLKTYLVFIPTILLSSLVPTMSAVLLTVATRLNEYENYETQDAYHTALTQKIFVINFITSYLPICLTAFVYVPYADRIVPYLDVFRLTVRPFVSKEHASAARADFSIDPARLRNQVIYFTVTAQIVGFAMETIVPYVKQHLLREYKAYRKNNQSNGNGDSSEKTVAYDDPAEEVQFLTRVRNEADLPAYEVTDDFREMCIQFGYLALFSPTWPLVPVSFLINNWVELRSDFFKICIECRRPVPQRCDTIGPWLDSLGFLAWVGSLSSAALVHLFRNGVVAGTPPDISPKGLNNNNKGIEDISGWALLLTLFCSEHLYLAVRYAVRAAMDKFEPPNARRERAARYVMRKRLIESSLNSNPDTPPGETSTEGLEDQITPASLEADARDASLHDTDPTEKFWTHQRGWRESAQIGARIMAQGVQEAKKEK